MAIDDKMVFLGVDVDFEKRIPESIHIRNIKTPEPMTESGDDVINFFGMIVAAADKYEFIFRFRFPSGNKQMFHSKPTASKKKLVSEVDDTIALMCTQLKSEVVYAKDYDVPTPAKLSFVQFSEFLNSTDEFDFFSQQNQS